MKILRIILMKDFYNLDTLPEIDLPVRCFTCNKVIGNMFYKWLEEEKKLSEEQLNSKIKNKIIMDNLGLDSECCRSVVLSHVFYKTNQ